MWLVFPIWIYVFAVVKPIYESLKGSSKLKYLETNGILDALLFYAIGLVIYVVMQLRSRRPASTRRCCSRRSRRTETTIATRLYIASDFHAAEKAWRKFLNAIKLNVYKADVALVAGDLTGKAIVPIVERNGGYETELFGVERSRTRRRRPRAARARHRRRRATTRSSRRPKRPSGCRTTKPSATFCCTA